VNGIVYVAPPVRSDQHGFPDSLSEEDDYQLLLAGADGVLRSRVFPGLWLDAAVLLAEDGARVLARLQEGLQSAEHASFVTGLQRRAG
jgi:hypothetical protein